MRGTFLMAWGLLVGASPALAGMNPEGELAMHCVASDDYLYCPELTEAGGSYLPIDCLEIDNDILPEELGTSGYAYVVFCCYNIMGIVGLEWCVTGFPSFGGFPPALAYCPPASVVLGNPFAGGGIQTFQGECLEPQVPCGGIVAFGYSKFNASGQAFTLSYCPSSYTYGADPHNYFLDCTPHFGAEDCVYSEHGCTIGGPHSEPVPYEDCHADITASDPTTWSNVKAMYHE